MEVTLLELFGVVVIQLALLWAQLLALCEPPLHLTETLSREHWQRPKQREVVLAGEVEYAREELEWNLLVPVKT